ncbi:hypothetical protein L228DRAFT_252999 [Xylona heveae TC161]|uniref:Aromatic amino acid beta-eliminating lyase/threonine aldolase domain-containing protein n=1 Tax=Xylona heveae (strain CBS 132557 / TC161) TaxID=1328760 RepID=A0A165HLE7_XYLHT|nr:hypothetical protein L228DRAFT_252999 [Xylona heveae TC161]KZF23691.1 hypothetical protein L228DRAFT_252999 [Xylona heveae TC161]
MSSVTSPDKSNTWAQPSAAEFDFRSDTLTTPTASMLHAISRATLQDDVYREDATTNSLESSIAQLCEHEAGLFVMSGTMGNQLALRTHLTQPPHSVLCDHRAHILRWECGTAAFLSGAMLEGIVPSNGSYLTLEDIKRHVVLGDEIHSCPTRVISLENTLGGGIMPVAEMQRISAFARQHGIKLHLDGARLWEAAAAINQEAAATTARDGVPPPAPTPGINDFTRLFDSISLCFSKGLGAPVGSMLVGRADFIKRARWFRKAMGGGIRQAGILTAAARVAVDETFGKGPRGEGGKLQGTHARAKRIARAWEGLGGTLEAGKKVETNMVWLDLDKSGVSVEELVAQGEKHGLTLRGGGRLVVHYQISDEAERRLVEVMRTVLRDRSTATATATADAQVNGGKEGKEGYRSYG